MFVTRCGNEPGTSFPRAPGKFATQARAGKYLPRGQQPARFEYLAPAGDQTSQFATRKKLQKIIRLNPIKCPLLKRKRQRITRPNFDLTGPPNTRRLQTPPGFFENLRA